MGLPRIIVDGGLAHRSFEVPSEIGVGGTWEPEGSPLVVESISASSIAVLGDRVLKIREPFGGGVKQRGAAAGRFLNSAAPDTMWVAQVWCRTVSGTSTATIEIDAQRANGSTWDTSTDDTAIDSSGWTLCSTALTVQGTGAYQAEVRLLFSGDETIYCDLAAFGPAVYFDLPWKEFQPAISPMAHSSRSLGGVVNVQYFDAVEALSISTAPEDSTVLGYMEDVHEYLMRGFAFDAYPDIDSTSKLYVGYVRPGLPLAHVQGKGRELYRWDFTAEKQGLSPGEYL